MADNVTTPFGTFASDDLGGAVQLQHTAIRATAKGGALTYRNLDLKATAGSLVKAAAGKLITLVIANQHATLKRYVKLYDKVSAPSSADTPVATIPVMPVSTIAVPLTDIGEAFTAGIGMRASTAIGDADNTDPTANDVVVMVTYF